MLYGVGNADPVQPGARRVQKRFPGIELVRASISAVARAARRSSPSSSRRNYVVDVVISGTDTQNELVQNGFIEPYQAAELAASYPSWCRRIAQNNPRTVSIFTVAINTTLVPPDQEPKTYKDLLDPKWKGKLAMDDPRGSGPGGTILSGMEVLYGIDEVDQKLAAQNIFFATQAGPILEALNRGEYAVYLSSNHTDVIAQRKSGAPIKQIKPIGRRRHHADQPGPDQERAASQRGQTVDRVEPLGGGPEACWPRRAMRPCARASSRPSRRPA